jgi:hypothetical protein
MKLVGLTIFILLINCGQFRADEVSKCKHFYKIIVRARIIYLYFIK